MGDKGRFAVVPGYYLVCYNIPQSSFSSIVAVVPGYYLVCYNRERFTRACIKAVVPGYYLVCYNTALSVYSLSLL